MRDQSESKECNEFAEFLSAIRYRNSKASMLFKQIQRE